MDFLNIVTNFSNMVKIAINTQILNNASAELQSLSTQIRSRSLNICFSESKGSSADALVHAAATIKECGDAFAALVEKTGSITTQAASLFREADHA